MRIAVFIRAKIMFFGDFLYISISGFPLFEYVFRCPVLLRKLQSLIEHKTGVVLYHREENDFVAEDSTLAST